MSRPLSPELSLAAACCRWPLNDPAGEAIRDAVDSGIDWDLFERVVRRNRIVPLVNHTLSRAGAEVPAPLRQRLSEDAHLAGAQALQMARESLRLQNAFDEAGIPLMIVKGAPLAMLAYGELSMKESWDIDLLVTPEDAPRAIGLLAELDYEGDLANVPADRLGGVLTYSKEIEFRRGGITAELHWRLSDNPRLLDRVGARSGGQDVAIPGGRLRTLADEELFAYLCVHGTAHNWSRLKWLADLGAMLGRCSPDEIAQLHDAARACNVGRCVSVAMLLCHRLLGLALPERLLRALEQDRVAQGLVRNALAGLAYRQGTFEMRPYTWPWVRMMTAQFFVGSGGAHGLHQLRTVWNSPGDRARVALPRGTEFGYHLLRVPLWLGRVSRRTWAALGRSSLS
jgi:hypothetical protein